MPANFEVSMNMNDDLYNDCKRGFTFKLDSKNMKNQPVKY